MIAVGCASFAAFGTRADADTGVGSGGDGSLQLIPEVITNAGISAGGSTEFPVKAELFLPAMDQRSRERAASEAAITDVVGSVRFDHQLDPLFVRDTEATRRRLFSNYTPQALPSRSVDSAAESNDLWLAVMVIAALPTMVLAVFLGRKSAMRKRSKRGRAAH